MPYSLIIQYPYEGIDIALCQNGLILESVNLHKFDAIGKTIPSINELLKSKNLTLSEISFLAANVGPGPYNTLRAILTMFNGIHRVNKIPLIGINALDLMSEEITEPNYLIVLNAFENHVFYKLKNTNKTLYGANSATELTNIINLQPDKLIIQGNGSIKYQQIFEKNNKIVYPKQINLFNKLETLATISHKKYTQNDFYSDYLKPIYFEDLTTN